MGPVRARLVVLCAAMVAIGLVPIPGAAQVSASPQGHPTKRVGSLVLTPCAVLPHAWCGHINRRWDPTGQVKGHLSVGFAFIAARDQAKPVLGTVVPHEGGPGYSTTGSAIDYSAMYGPLLRRRNMLLVDQRGTGRTAVINCPQLQNLHGPYDVAAKQCSKPLGKHSDLYGSALSADDQAAVIRGLDLGKVELYGDSYGTFFTQVFAGRHPGQVASIVLDSAYPTTGETQWYPTQTPAMRQSFATVCRRSLACRSGGGSPMSLLRRVLHHVRHHPYRGVAYDADGVRHHAVVNGAALVAVAFGATYGPAYYRELTASLRSALHGDREPLLRLVAENVDSSSDAGAARAYSEGLDAAVTCQDYPQLYDMADSPAKRLVEYKASVRREQRQDPRVYAPFTIEEYLHSVWEEADWCLKWPSPSPAHPAEPPAPPSGHYPSVPTMILSGELDSITTPAEGAMVAAAFPQSREVHIANSFHVTAEDDSDGCGVLELRHFVRHPERTLSSPNLACTRHVPPVRALGRYRPSFTATRAAHPGPGNRVGRLGRRGAAAAAETVADVLDRWFNNYSSHGVGLYGGTWTYKGNRTVNFRLRGVRLERDLAVSGTVRWARYQHHLTCDLAIRRVNASGHSLAGAVRGHWNTRRQGAKATLHGHIDGRALHVSMVAP